MWMVRNNGGDYAEEFIKRSMIAIGWKSVGSLKNLKTRNDMIQKVRETYPDYKKLQAVIAGSQLDKFANVMRVGDQVLTYDPDQRKYHVGSISGDYLYQNDEVEDDLINQRSVNWRDTVLRDSLSVQTKNSLGSSLTIFEVSRHAEEEIEKLLAGSALDIVSESDQEDGAAVSETTSDVLLADLKARSKEFIKDKIVALDWSEMQELVAGILRAMNYKTQVSPKGSDRGKDIVASPDGFGFENPRIIVEVKHRPNQQMGSPEIRSFLGGRHPNDRGLYVSTGGFTREARYEAERAPIPLSLLDMDGLAEALIDYYEQLDLSTRTLVPLTRIYWPS